MLNKSHLLDFNLIATFVMVGIPGVLIGLAANLHPFYVILSFQILVLAFAVVFFYLNVLAPRASPSAVPTPQTPPVPAEDSPPRSDSPNSVLPSKDYEGTYTALHAKLATASMWTAAFLGGFITANVGCGSDIMLYAYGLLGWNLLVGCVQGSSHVPARITERVHSSHGGDATLLLLCGTMQVPESKRLSDTSLTASSVVVMGLLSLVCTVCRALTRSISSNVIFCWGATCWIVCFGAPLGSLLLTPGLRAQLRIAFYVLAIAQFVGFAVLKIRGNLVAWLIFATVNVVVLILLKVHHVSSQRSLKAKGTLVEKLSAASVKKRLLK